MGRTEIDSASKTSTFNMFGEVSSSSITVWEPGHRYATREDKNPDGTFMAIEWLIESRDGSGAVVRFVHSGLLGENWRPNTTACPSATGPVDRDRGVAELARRPRGLINAHRPVGTGC